jgi:hypothetical protein
MIYFNLFLAVISAMLLGWWFGDPEDAPFRRFMMAMLALTIALNVAAVAMAL